jgi:hypothetical protein
MLGALRSANMCARDMVDSRWLLIPLGKERDAGVVTLVSARGIE